MKKLNKNENTSFGLVMASGFAVLAWLRWWSTGATPWWLVLTAFIWVVLAVVCPGVLRPLRTGWLKLAHLMGVVNGTIILSVMFAVIITPIAVMMRMIGKQPIHGRGGARGESYWRPRRPDEFTAGRMERQF